MVSIRADADGLCLRPGPLRFGPCAGTEPWELESLPDSALHLHSGPLTLRVPNATEDTTTRLCADRWCIRCLGRGNGNRAKMQLCLPNNYEAVRSH